MIFLYAAEFVYLTIVFFFLYLDQLYYYAGLHWNSYWNWILLDWWSFFSYNHQSHDTSSLFVSLPYSFYSILAFLCIRVSWYEMFVNVPNWSWIVVTVVFFLCLSSSSMIIPDIFLPFLWHLCFVVWTFVGFTWVYGTIVNHFVCTASSYPQSFCFFFLQSMPFSSLTYHTVLLNF